MGTDIVLFLIFVLAVVGFLLMLFVVKDSQTVAEREASRHDIATSRERDLVGYGILAGIYAVLFVCALFLRNRQT